MEFWGEQELSIIYEKPISQNFLTLYLLRRFFWLHLIVQNGQIAKIAILMIKIYLQIKYKFIPF